LEASCTTSSTSSSVADREYDRQYGSIDLSTRGPTAHNTSKNNKNKNSNRNDSEIGQGGSAATQADHSNLPRKNPRYHAIKNFEEAQSKILKPKGGAFDIGL
jgi:hypothetical protein